MSEEITLKVGLFFQITAFLNSHWGNFGPSSAE